MTDPWKNIRERVESVSDGGDFGPGEAVDDLLSVLADADALQQALHDIAHGMVPPEFLTGIENETKESFQTRLATWSQKRAREALANLKGE